MHAIDRRDRPGPTQTAAISAAILELLLPHRRAAERDLDPGRESVADFPEQLDRLADFVARGEPVVFALPGFPCKSPNPAKVLGHLPDEGERLSLAFLDGLCASVAAVHPPGARMLICSDGHVFADLVRVPDAHVDAYTDELRAVIADNDLDRLSVFDLRDVLGDDPTGRTGPRTHADKRAWLHARHAPTLAELRAQVRSDEDTLRLYRGITRFLFEDTADFPGTRSALQRDCRDRAYGVIQRSRAWSDLIAEHHPRAVRLSIHPQRRGADKFGIRLLDAPDVWATPWHATVLRRPDGPPRLLHRAEAARLGTLIHHDGRPSHFSQAAH
ncbi:pyoverdine biosynthesis protein PvcA [Embleya scabrispora]|uniref:Pyoverdine biosynthesis protein PvcA n=1 Tax=Embleya scabrispora TaxID=159449 RepID=A0A1T3NRN0_9ACTN|nr:isocyanide synthase family protein [Embleya scabrispora]OPC79395.1 pyoverdine biosynthesis protein PvcA [Embleya scabrispora]